MALLFHCHFGELASYKRLGLKGKKLELLWSSHELIKLPCFTRRPRPIEAKACFMFMFHVSPRNGFQVDSRVTVQGSITRSLDQSAVRQKNEDRGGEPASVGFY